MAIVSRILTVIAVLHTVTAARIKDVNIQTSKEVHERYPDNHIDRPNTFQPQYLSTQTEMYERNIGMPEQIDHHALRTVSRRKSRWKESEIEKYSSSNVTDANRYRRDIGSSHIIITQHFNEKIARSGDDVSLVCAATANRPPRFAWERDGIAINSNFDTRYILGQMMSSSGVGVLSHLNISRLRVEDGGLYSCTAFEGESSVKHSARIDVFGPPYIRALPPIKVQSGEMLKLRCPYYGYPISSLEWEHKGKKISTTHLSQHSRFKRSILPNRNSDVLNMITSNSSHNVLFIVNSIEASNKILLDRNFKNLSNQVNVIMTDKNISNNKKIREEHYVNKPIIEDYLIFKIKTYSKRVRRKREVFESNEDGVLVVPNVDREEHGDSYTCIVYSPSGEMARRSFEIQIVEAPLLDDLRMGTGLKEGQIVQITCNIISGDPPIYFSWLKDGKKIPGALKINERSSELFSVLIIKRVSLEHCGKYTCIATNHVGKVNQTADLYINVAPKWVEEPKNTSLLLGQRGIVYCNANGYPTPQIHWMKRDATLGIWRPVLDLAGGGIMSYPNGTLVIEVVSLSDEGMYACNVENGVGDPLNKNLWINVNKPVHFETLGNNVTTKIGLPATLTCLPLGDSPIRVKWTVNGNHIDFTSSRITVSETPTHNGIKSSIIINYVEGRDGGLYECRASNPYGAANYNILLSILEPPAAPIELVVESISQKSARVHWRRALRAQHYKVQYSRASDVLWDSAMSVNFTGHDNEIRQTMELRGLQPATDYKLRVASVNQVDQSTFTQAVHFVTLQEAPSSAPLNVQASATENPGELVISWLSPPKDAHNGPLQGYHVKAVPRIAQDISSEESQTKVIKVMPKKGKQEITLSGLLKNMRYAVSVSAFNSAGNGPFSLPIYQTTREGAPEHPPSGLECRGISSTSLRVAWQPISDRGAALLGYSVLYCTDDGSWQNLTSPHTEVYLQALQKFTNYTVKVAGFSNYGPGPFSFPITCTTLQDVPGPPAFIKLLVSSPTSLLVSWKRPEQPNGEITHYNVYLKPVSSTNSPQTFRVDSSQESNFGQVTYPITGLAIGKQYEVTVTANTLAGEGMPSSRVSAEVTSKVVAGVSSLGGAVWVRAGDAVLLACSTAGVPAPRTVWYHRHYIITHHPRFTRNHDDSLLINNIDQSLSGNYTCLAKNLYGSDSVSYEVVVQPIPDPPDVRVTPSKNALHVEWEPPKNIGEKLDRISYELSWRESSSTSWLGNTIVRGTSHTISGLKCGSRYTLHVRALASKVSSPPALKAPATVGSPPIAPSSTEWFWSNASHIFIQLSGWDDNGCEITKWEIDYKEYGTKYWKKAENQLSESEQHWSYSGVDTGVGLAGGAFVVGALAPARWYTVRVRARNSAGVTTSLYNYATTDLAGESIGPPSELFDLNMVVIVCSSALLLLCSASCVYILVKRHNQQRLTAYRNSLTAECKSERSNVTANTPQSLPPDSRVYSAPVHLAADSKHELYEISPYAQFAIGFRTFGHVDNQEAPSRVHGPGNSKSRYDSETSFQMRSESEESDCMSRSTTLKSAPRKSCRVPHHR